MEYDPDLERRRAKRSRAGIVKSVKVYVASKRKLRWVTRWLGVTATRV